MAWKCSWNPSAPSRWAAAASISGSMNSRPE